MSQKSLLYYLSCFASTVCCIEDLIRDDIGALVRRSDLLETDSQGGDLLMWSFCSHKKHNLNFSTDTWSYLIQNSNLKNINIFGFNALHLYISSYKKQHIHLSKSNQIFLFDHSDVGIQNKSEWSVIDYIFCDSRNKENLFTPDRIDYLVENFELSKKVVDQSEHDERIKNHTEYCVSKERNLLHQDLTTLTPCAQIRGVFKL